MGFPRYPEYKDSGVEWLGAVPTGWDVWKLAQAFSVVGSGTTPRSENRAYYDDGDIAWLNTGDLNDGELLDCENRVTSIALAENTALRIFPAGSLVIAMYGATIGKLGVLRFSATVNQACCVFGGDSPISCAFMFYSFLGFRPQILSLATGGGQLNISQEILRNLRVPCPSDVEQTTIATFLDHETAKIDALITEQQHLIALLKEKRQAVISHAVTKGLDPAVAMKDSGVEWLGRVPGHWTCLQVGKVCDKVSDGPHFSPNYVEEGVLFLSARNVKVDNWALEDVKYVSASDCDEFDRRVIPQPGDVLYTKGGTTGIARVVDFNQRFQVWVHIAVLKVKKDAVDSRFLALALNSQACYEQSQLLTRGATNNDLGLTRMVKIWFVLPTFDEQRQIVRVVEADLAKLDTLTTESTRAIALLVERRIALISAAVTGKIDVRNLAQQP